ncbi:MAG: DNA primase [Pirellulaceae bacterium]
MSLGPAHDIKEQVRQSVDIVDLIGGYLELRRQGRQFVARCPWHDDSRPSLQINQERQSWKCWVCDIGGDVFSFVMQREGIGFREALEMLAERAGIQLQAARQTLIEPGSPEDKRTLYRAVQWAEQQYHQCLLRSPDAESARDYLEGRGITPETIERFRIGFAPAAWDWLLKRAGQSREAAFSPQVLTAVGLAGFSEQSRRHYDFFRGRVMFPIRDTQRRPIAFGGRILPEIARQEEQERGRAPAKYINPTETRLYSKSEQLYGLDMIRDAVSKSRHIVIVEGYTDVVLPFQYGLENFAAVCGTALGPRHLRLLRSYADTITLLLDGDTAGQRRTNEILELFVAEQVDLRVLTLPEGLDPCDYVRDHGAEAFRALLATAVDALEHKVRVTTQGIDPAADTHRANVAVEEILATLAKAPRTPTSASGATRLREQQLLSRLARQFYLPESELWERMNQLRRGAKPLAAAAPHFEDAPPSARLLESLDPRQVELLEIMTLDPALAARAVVEIDPEHLSGAARALFAAFGRLTSAGESPEFGVLMSSLEDPRLKNLLVLIDEQAHEKEQQALQGAEQRLDGLIESFEQGREDVGHRARLTALDQKQLDEQEQLDVLQQLIAQQRKRQGISSPTEG